MHAEKCRAIGKRRMKDYLTIFHESCHRILESETQRDEFFEAFYEAFMSKSDEIAAKFEHTDMQRQKEMLHQSLHHMFDFSMRRKVSEELRRIAERHSASQINIEPRLYDIWLDSLIDTVRMFDSLFAEEVEFAWRVTLAPGIAYMRFKYDKPAGGIEVPIVGAELESKLDKP